MKIKPTQEWNVPQNLQLEEERWLLMKERVPLLSIYEIRDRCLKEQTHRTFGGYEDANV